MPSTLELWGWGYYIDVFQCNESRSIHRVCGVLAAAVSYSEHWRSWFRAADQLALVASDYLIARFLVPQINPTNKLDIRDINYVHRTNIVDACKLSTS